MRVLCNDMIIDPQDCRPFTSAPSLLWRWETSSWPRSFSRRNWRWRYPRSCAVWPGTACERLPPAKSRPVGRGWMRSSICWMPCGCSLGNRWMRSGRSPSRSACWGIMSRTSTTPRRPMSCGRCRGGPSPPWSCCALYTLAQEDRKRGWISGGPGRGAGNAGESRER